MYIRVPAEEFSGFTKIHWELQKCFNLTAITEYEAIYRYR